MSVRTKLRKLLTWRFVLEQLFKGILQAVGAVAVYISIVLVIINSPSGSRALRDALALRAPGLNQLSGTASGSSSSSSSSSSSNGGMHQQPQGY